MNEEPEKTKDLAITEDGAITTGNGTSIEVKTEPTTEPEINEAQAPTEPEVVEVESTTTEEVASEVSAVESEPQEEPIASQEVIESNEVVSPSSDFGTTPSSTPMNTDAGQPAVVSMPTNTPNEHRNNKKLAVIITIFVALLLAGAAVYVYISAEDNTAETLSDSQSIQQDSTTENESVTPATTSDVDQTVDDIDQALNEIDSETTTNANEEVISDENLGLN